MVRWRVAGGGRQLKGAATHVMFTAWGIDASIEEVVAEIDRLSRR